MFLTDDISITYRHTAIRRPWTLYAWLIDSLTLSTCHSPCSWRHVVFVTHLSLCIHSPSEGPCRGKKRRRYVKLYSHPQMQTHKPTPDTRVPSLYTCTPTRTSTTAKEEEKKKHLTCSFPAPKDRSGTAVTWEVTRLGGVRLSRLWESPTRDHRSLPAALAVWKVMGQSLTTMHR